ncbi:hypothetical protein BC332_28293 [Capsicum chinense]|nr:hypothetical protein BC332_28293 [Capsicum chinense]
MIRKSNVLDVEKDCIELSWTHELILIKVDFLMRFEQSRRIFSTEQEMWYFPKTTCHRRIDVDNYGPEAKFRCSVSAATVIFEYLHLHFCYWQFQHRNVVHFIGACTNSPQLCIITGIEYLYQNNIIHRDMKMENLLMDSNNVVKVSCFGVSRFLNNVDVMTADIGTYKYMASEVMHPAFPFRSKTIFVPTTTPSTIDDVDLEMAITAFHQSASQQRPTYHNNHPGSGTKTSGSWTNPVEVPSQDHSYFTGAF